MYKPGDLVRFTPTDQTLNWAAGIRKVKFMRNSKWVQLECGDIVLIASVDELTKL